LFYDTGKGFNETESVRYAVDQGEGIKDVIFGLPVSLGQVKSIRIDPGSQATLIKIKSIKLTSGGKEYLWNATEILHNFRPAMYIDNFSEKEGLLYVNSTGRDPAFISSFDFGIFSRSLTNLTMVEGLLYITVAGVSIILVWLIKELLKKIKFRFKDESTSMAVPLSNDTQTLYFDHINILRAFAALTVLTYHVIKLFQWNDFPTSWPLAWFQIGWMGVDLFFVISGFVVALVAMQLFRRHGNNFYKVFIIRRLARIAPLYYFTGLIFLIFITPQLFVNPNFYTVHLPLHLSFLHNVTVQTHGSINGVNWSIGTEMQFYLLILLLTPWIARTSPWRILILFTLASWCYRLTIFYFLEMSEENNSHIRFIYLTQLLGMLDEFGFGIFLAKIVIDKKFAEKENIKLKNWLVLFFSVALMTVICYVTLHLLWLGAGNYWHNPWLSILWRTMAGLSACSLIWVAIYLQKFFSKTVAFPLFYLGEISYGIYLWHLPVIMSVKKLTYLNHVQTLILVLGLTLLLSIFSWHFLEKPFIRRYQ